MENKLVATHDGAFHADDVFAVATLMRVFAVRVVRTRDPEVLAQVDLCVDVGGGPLDHHMTGGAGVRGNGVPYAAFGLVWRKYGDLICGDHGVAAMVDRRLVQSVDAGDTGYGLTQGNGGPMIYNVSNVISRFNPEWFEEVRDFDGAFDKAVEMASAILDREIACCRGVILAGAEVEAAMAVAEDKRVLVLKRFCPWFGPATRSSDLLFVIFPDGIGGDWRVHCVPTQPGVRDQRHPLPASWAGKNGEALVKLTGVADATFCHAGRFIAGARSKEGIFALVKLALAD